MVDRNYERIAGISLKVGAASLVLLFLISVYRGSSYLISKGFDPDHIPCGVEDLKNYPYIYFTNPDEKYKYKVVCVSTCPKPNSDDSFDPMTCVPNSMIKNCEQNISLMDPSQSTLVYDTFQYKGNVCIPRTLEYYDAIKDYSTPNLSQQLVSDILKSEYIIIMMAIFSLILSYFMMYFMKKQTKLMIWGFSLGVYLLVAGLGIYFAMEWKVAKDYNKETKIVGTFEVSEKYIQELITEPSTFGSFMLMFFFGFCTLYGGWFIYNNYRRVDDIVDAFEIIELFLENQQDVQKFITYASGIFMLAFLIILRMIIQFGSCYQIQYLDNLGPFDHLKEGPIYYIHFILYPFIFWMIQTYIGSIQYFVCNIFRRWVYTSNEGDLLISTIQPNRAIFSSQIISQTNPTIIYQRGDFIQLFSKYNQIAYVSLLLVASPIKFIADFFRDFALKFKNHKYFPQIKKMLCGCFNYYKLTRDIEEVIYMEMALEPKEHIHDSRANIKKYLELSELDPEATIEVFESIRNTGDFFMLSVKLLVSLSTAAMTRWILTFFFNTLLYSLNGPTLFSAIIGYYVASVYFSAYQIGIQSLGYLYLREKKHSQTQHLNYFLHVKIKLGSFSNVINRLIEEQIEKEHQQQNNIQN